MQSVSIADMKNNKIVEFDKHKNLTLYCYDECNNNMTKTVKSSRGTVFDGDNKVFQGLPYTDEYVVKDGDNYGINNFKTTTFFRSYEGCLIRVFWHGDTWYKSTHHKLDACKSKWGAAAETYGDIFNKNIVWEDVVDKLDKKCGYLFLLENNENNRLVCRALENPNVWHVGTIKDNGELDIHDDIGVKKPVEVTFDDIKEMNEHIRDMDFMEHQGLIGFKDDGMQVKIYNDEYKKFLDSRGNENSIKFRYIQVRMDDDKMKRLRYLYPESCNDFDRYEELLDIIADFIYKSYVERFIYKQFKRTPKDEYKIIQLAHQWHLSDRDRNKISLHKIKSLLNEQSAVYLNRIIKRLKKFENYDNYNGDPKFQTTQQNVYVKSDTPVNPEKERENSMKNDVADS